MKRLLAIVLCALLVLGCSSVDFSTGSLFRHQTNRIGMRSAALSSQGKLHFDYG